MSPVSLLIGNFGTGGISSPLLFVGGLFLRITAEIRFLKDLVERSEGRANEVWFVSESVLLLGLPTSDSVRDGMVPL